MSVRITIEIPDDIAARLAANGLDIRAARRCGHGFGLGALIARKGNGDVVFKHFVHQFPEDTP